MKSNEHDWKDSAVLHVHDCGRLEVATYMNIYFFEIASNFATIVSPKFFLYQVSLTNGDRRSFSYLLDRSALILENIKELSFLKFEIGEKGVGDKDNEEAV